MTRSDAPRVPWLKVGRAHYQTADGQYRAVRQDSGRWELHKVEYGGWSYITTRDTLKAAKAAVGLYDLSGVSYEGDARPTRKAGAR